MLLDGTNYVNNEYQFSNKVKRMEFEFQDTTYTFILNPQEYSAPEVGRATVTQTKGGAFIDAFGAGLVEITFSGVTGYKNGTDDPTSGFKKFKELRDLIRKAWDAAKDDNTVDFTMKFYNYTDEDYYEVYPMKFNLKKSVSKPLLYMYEINLTCLKRLDAPASANITDMASATGLLNTASVPSTQNSYGIRNGISESLWGTTLSTEIGMISLDLLGNIVLTGGNIK